MKNVLIVSDNLDLASYLKDVSDTISSNVAEFNYCYSVVNKTPGKLKDIGMYSVDMKNKMHIDSIIAKYDLIISAHCKQIFPSKLVKSVRCINIHPGLNPYNRGWFPQVFSIINKKPIGCTIHLMDEEIDHGDIIYQKIVGINSWDTSLDLYNRVLSAEKELLDAHFMDLVNGSYVARSLDFEGNYNGIKDFHDLSQLNLSSNGTLAEHIDLLRALTHGEFNNAWFMDGQGNKIFVKLKLNKES